LDGSFAVFLDDLVLWQDVVEVLGMPLDVSIRQVFEEVLEWNGFRPLALAVSMML